MRRVLAAVLLLTSFGLGAAACVDDDAGAWLARAKSAHAAADRALSAGDIVAAREALASFAEQPPPHGVAPEDARVVRQDVHYRLSRLALEAGDPDAALRWAEEGLALGRGDDVFTANLYVARGQAREALGQPAEAAADYHEALKINEQLLEVVLEGEDP